MNIEYYEELINKETTGRYDVTPIFTNAEAFSNLIKDLTEPFKEEVDGVVGLEALGFILGSAVALELNTGFIPMRKIGKLPGVEKILLRTSFTDYSNEKKGLKINKNSINEGDNVIIVDDWIETGTQIKTAIKLIKELKGNVVGISVLKSEKNKETKPLFKKYNLHTIGIDE